MQDRRSLWLEAPNSVPLQCRSSPEELFARLPPLHTLGISFEDPDNPEPVLIANTYDRWVATWFPPFLRWLQVCCGRDLRDCADLLCLFSDKGCLCYASHSIAHSLGSDLVHLSVEVTGTEALASELHPALAITLAHAKPQRHFKKGENCPKGAQGANCPK